MSGYFELPLKACAQCRQLAETSVARACGQCGHRFCGPMCYQLHLQFANQFGCTK